MKILISAILLVSLTVFGATYHVTKTGNDSTGDGSVGSPWLTVQKGFDSVNPGDTLLIGAGYYDETATTGEDLATNESPVTVDGQGLAVMRRLIVDSPYHRIQNLAVSNSVNTFLMRVNRGSHWMVVSNCVFDANLVQGIIGIEFQLPSTTPFNTDAPSDCLLVSNRITRIRGTTGVVLTGDRNVFRGNKLHDVVQADFLRVWGRTNIITANWATNNAYEASLGWHPDFIQTFGLGQYGSFGHIIEGNVVSDIEAGQIMQLEANVVPEIRDWTFRNNIFARVALQASSTIPGLKIYNNLFYRCNDNNNAGHAFAFGTRSYTLDNNWTAGSSSSHGTHLLNNIFYECGQSGTNGGYYGFGTELTNVIANYNYSGKNVDKEMRRDPAMLEIGNLAGWDNFRWYEINGLNGGNPGLADVMENDFRVTTNSILIGAGTNLSHLFTGTIDGLTRTNSGPWTVGPYMSQSASGPVPPVIRRAMRLQNLTIQQISQ